MFKRSISTILNVSISISVITAIALLIIYVSYSSSKMALELEEHAMTELTESTVKALDEYIQGGMDLTYTISMDGSVTDAIISFSNQVAQDRLENYMKEFRRNFHSILIFNENGDVVAGMNYKLEPFTDLNVAGKVYAKSILSGQSTYISDTVKQTEEGEAFIEISRIVKERDGTIMGGIVVMPKWNYFTDKFIDKVSIGKRGSAFIVDRDGTIVAHSKNKKLISENLSDRVYIKNMLGAEGGVQEYNHDGEDKVLTFGTSSKNGWKVVMSAFVDELESTARVQTRVLTGAGIFIVVFLLSLIIFIINQLVVEPISRLETFVGEFAKGDLTSSPKGKFKYELNRLASAMDSMRLQFSSIFGEVNRAVHTLLTSSDGLADISEKMNDDTQVTSTLSGKVAVESGRVNEGMGSVAAAMEQASANVSTVAAATEEMTVTINEVAKNAENAREITGEAVSQSERVTEHMARLSDAAVKINRVIEVISEISEQTNLLALNATIEAARAGEAGRGFAVVAGEIKGLAGQTSGATEEIRMQIEEIQTLTSNAVKEISTIAEVIRDVNSNMDGTASAVEEQAVTTSEIAGNIAQASMGIEDVKVSLVGSTDSMEAISKDISEMDSSVVEMSKSGEQINMQAMELIEIADNLKGLVAKIKI